LGRNRSVRASAAALLAVFLMSAVAAGEAAKDQRVTRVPLANDEPTRLLASHAVSANDRLRRGENGARWVVGWDPAGVRSIAWDVDVVNPGEYAASVLLDHESGAELEIELRIGADVVRLVSRATRAGVRYRASRLTAAAPLTLKAGSQRLELRLQRSVPGPFEVAVFAVEIVPQADVESIGARVSRLRPSTDAFVSMRHGFMVHYTPESYPRHGTRRPWADAVRDFDVESFAEQMRRGGAGFVVLVTAHMQWSFPAPLSTVDAQISGRTTQRDLIADIEAALARRGIRLMLYVNPAWDAALRQRIGDDPRADARLLQIWNDTLTEIGERYADRVFGFWFDKGPWFYEFAPSWQALHAAARSGHPNRLVSWNRSRLPMLTEFQDFDSCEKCDDPSAGGNLPTGGDGRYHGGPSPGLQAAATLLAEHSPEGVSADAWVHRWPNTEIAAPRWSPQELAALLQSFAIRRNVPIFNLGIYQDGSVSERTLEVFSRAIDLAYPADAMSPPRAGIPPSSAVPAAGKCTVHSCLQ
jgi:hypothetical protein